MISKWKILLCAAFTFVFVCGLTCLSTAQAQSGRRTPKPATLPAPTPEPTPAVVTSRPNSQPTLRFILGMEHADAFMGASLNAASGVRRSCAQRLAERDGIKVDVSPREMMRSDAVKLAKAEKDSYVIWLRLREDSISARQNETEVHLYIEYMVLAPVTAKVVTSGSTYPQNRNSNVILGRRTTSIDGDYYLNRAARETADRILAKFSLHAPRIPPLAVVRFQFSEFE